MSSVLVQSSALHFPHLGAASYICYMRFISVYQINSHIKLRRKVGWLFNAFKWIHRAPILNLTKLVGSVE